jgi:Domain of unknown function (DUF4157)
MFAPRVGKTQTKAAASRTNSLAHQRSPLVAHRPSHDWGGLVHMLQRTIGNQATTRVAERGKGSALTMVEETLHSPGQSLDPAIRNFTEVSFGRDFSQVKVHTDARAAESARGVNALAYTSGNHIAFDAGQYAPETPTGMRLLSHELTHVVQQRRAPVLSLGVSVADDFHERQAGAVADALMRGGAIAGHLDSGSGPACPSLQRDTPRGTPGPAQPPPQPLRPVDYDRDVHRPKVPDAVQTLDNLKHLLDAKVASHTITSYAVKGVMPDGTPIAGSRSNREMFLHNLLYWYVDNFISRSKGVEADLVTAIDRPAKPGGPAPRGRVTLLIDARGAASAELIDAGPVPAVTQIAVTDGSDRLKADFGFVAVTGWGNTTTDAAEISDVLAALSLLKSRAPQDIAALKGVELIRVRSLGPTTGGEFSKGEIAGKKPWLKLADLAFSVDDVQFFGGGPGSPTVPSSFQTILHEVGHAVEAEELRSAQEDFAKASAEQDAAKAHIHEEDKTYTAEYEEAKRKGKLSEFYKKRVATHKKAEEAEDKASAHVMQEASKVESTKVAASTVKPFETDATAKKTSATNSLTAAKAAVQALSPDEIQSSAAYVTAVDETAAAITSFPMDVAVGQKTIDDLESVVLQKAGDREQARIALLRAGPPKGPALRAISALDPAVQAQDAWFAAERVLARARQRTRRLQKFIDLVAAKNIRRFTQYSVENWQFRPGEFYAEAYSLWLVDPEFLRTNYQVVFDFFQSGDYRK